MDLPFLVLVLTLVAFGLVMLFSASYAVALYRRGDAYAYIRPQLLYAALGLAAMWLASRVDYHLYHKLAWSVLGVSLVLLTVVLFMPEYNGCKRWLVIPGVGTLQPRSEEHTSELQSRFDLVCRLLLEKKNRRYFHASTSKNSED